MVEDIIMEEVLVVTIMEVVEVSLLEVDLLLEDIIIMAKDLLNQSPNLRPMPIIIIMEDIMEVVALLEEVES